MGGHFHAQHLWMPRPSKRLGFTPYFRGNISCLRYFEGAGMSFLSIHINIYIYIHMQMLTACRNICIHSFSPSFSHSDPYFLGTLLAPKGLPRKLEANANQFQSQSELEEDQLKLKEHLKNPQEHPQNPQENPRPPPQKPQKTRENP